MQVVLCVCFGICRLGIVVVMCEVWKVFFGFFLGQFFFFWEVFCVQRWDFVVGVVDGICEVKEGNKRKLG